MSTAIDALISAEENSLVASRRPASPEEGLELSRRSTFYHSEDEEDSLPEKENVMSIRIDPRKRFSEKPPEDTTKKEEHGPKQTELYFQSSGRILSKRNKLKHEDLWELRPEHRSSELYGRLNAVWIEALKRKEKDPKYTPSLFIAILKTFRAQLTLALFLFLLYSLFSFAPSVILPFMVEYISDHSIPYWYGFVYTAVVLVCTLLASLCYYHSLWQAALLGMKIRVCMMAAVYRKAMRLPKSKGATGGQIVNLYAADSQLVFDGMQQIIPGVVAPVQLIGAIIFLGFYIDYYALVVAAVFLTVVPVTIGLGNKVAGYRREIQRLADTRLKLTTEFIQGIRIVKYYAWEDPFYRNIRAARDLEMEIIKKLSLCRAGVVFFVNNTNTLSLALAFLFYGLFGGGMTVQKAFTVIAILNVTRQPFAWSAVAYLLFSYNKASIDRVSQFLLTPEKTEYVQKNPNLFEGSVQVKDANFFWNNEGEPVIRGLDFKINPGEKVMVVGKVGSGKTSLTMGLLGEMPFVEGSVTVNGKIAYVPQQAWIYNATVRDNILFGLKYDIARYSKVVETAALIPDFEQFKSGDLTEVGDRGVNLSGGQRQRIAIARALYADREIYMFDDPLSAVDPHVSKYLFKNVVQEYLKDRTVIMVTNQLQYLPYADKVIFLADGAVAGYGSFTNLRENNSKFSKLMKKYGVLEKDKKQSRGKEEKILRKSKKEEKILRKPKKEVKEKIEKVEIEIENEKGEIEKEKEVIEKEEEVIEKEKEKEVEVLEKEEEEKETDSEEEEIEKEEVEKEKPKELTEDERNKQDEQKKKDGALTVGEEKKSGLIPMKIYWYYLKSGRLVWWWLCFAGYCSYATVRVLDTWWLEQWTIAAAAGGPNYSQNYWSFTYLGWLLSESVTLLIALSIGLGMFSVNTSRNLHNNLLKKISYAVTSFFDATPLGRILSRFAQDLATIDFLLSIAFIVWLNYLFLLLSTIAGFGLGVWWIFVAVLPLVGCYIGLQIYFRKTNIEIQRIESLSRAPPISHLTSTLSGLDTIRAFGRIEGFTKLCDKHLDHNDVEKFSLKFCNMWYGLRLDLIGAFMILEVFLGVTFARMYLNLDPGSAGIAMSFTSGFTALLSSFSVYSSDLEIRMNSVERFHQYNILEQEKVSSATGYEPPQEWPQNGDLTFEDFTFKYRNGPEVLKNLTLAVKSKSKTAIVGRTGAGKSSLLQALYRIEEPVNGTIYIDGVDFTTVGLKDLRSKLAIIPQDPTLFMASLRYNLDPFNNYTDEDIWSALELVQLRESIMAHPDKLEQKCEENGANFSVGQRQLLCMARAVLKKSSVLLLDEATASVDVETDALIQSTIRRAFNNCTVLTIAHRLNTIMDSSMVLVLDKGRVAEYDSPLNLLKNKDGIFHSMVYATGPDSAEYLIKLAEGKVSVMDHFSSESSKGKTAERRKLTRSVM